jgi:hypothetical protein
MNDNINFETINSLLALYQKAIEYFSAQDSERYEDFLNRNKTLMLREDVQIVLASMQDEEVKSNDDGDTRQQQK